ncbi:uncharacterized protein LOC108143991 [Drosophila elegans]|uniref:uncharacterized protein LOC108143991 n=1 Tax=Drosophila elegans TaxID=30023 RepID=UPI0007E77FE3|nr:uncharacterized protein LOC108143991 [Drosophila elegans]
MKKMAAPKAVAGAQLPEGKGTCVLCAAVAARVCQRCGDFYCAKDCQLKDWPRHRYICFPLPALVHPKSYSVHLTSEELSLEEACAVVNTDKTVVGASPSPAPFPTIIPDIRSFDIGSNVNTTRSIAPKGNLTTPNPTPIPINNNASNISGIKTKNKNNSPPNAIMPPSNSLVCITGFRSANRCNIRDASEIADRAFAQVCEKVNAIGNELPNMVKPRPGLCLARHNGMFQRARVMNFLSNNSARLLFIDQGITKSRTVSDMREINMELVSLPCLSLLVQLKDVPNYAITDEVIAFVSQFEGEKFIAIHEKTPGCIYVELLYPDTKQSLNAKIRDFCSNRKVYETHNSFNNKKNEVPKQQNSPTGQESTITKQSIPNAPIVQSQATAVVHQQLVKNIEPDAKVLGQSENLSKDIKEQDFKKMLPFIDSKNKATSLPNSTSGRESTFFDSFINNPKKSEGKTMIPYFSIDQETSQTKKQQKSDPRPGEIELQNFLRDLEASNAKMRDAAGQKFAEPNHTKTVSEVCKNYPPKEESQESLKKLDAEVKNQEETILAVAQEFSRSNLIKTISEVCKNDPPKTESPTSDIVSQEPLKPLTLNAEIKNQEERIPTAEDNVKADDPTEQFSEFFRSFVNKNDIQEQDIKKLSPREILAEFLRCKGLKDVKDSNISEVTQETHLNLEKDKKPEETKAEEIKFIKDEPNTKKLALDSQDNALPGKDVELISAHQEIKTAPRTLAKSKDEEVKEFLTQCLVSKTTSTSDKAIPLGLPQLKEKLDLLSISRNNPQVNGIVKPKNEPLLKPPFELRRFSIQSKEGIDVFVVDNSKMARGIFGAFDSTYACEFSTLHSRLSEITNSEPYKPVAREYVLARFEGLWYRGRVEQIITTKQSQTECRVMYLDYTNVEDITEKDIRRYPLDFTTPCNTNLCVIEDFPHKPNPAQISYLSEVLKVHQIVHIDGINYLNNIAIVTARSLIAKLMSL